MNDAETDAAAAPLRITRRFAAPVARVFEAWTRPDDLARWAWGALGRNVTAAVDLREGGAYVVTTERPDGPAWAFSGEYLEVRPRERLRYTIRWSAPMGYESPGEVVTVELRTDGDGTEITMTHDGVPGAEARATHEAGWVNTFEHLDELLRRG